MKVVVLLVSFLFCAVQHEAFRIIGTVRSPMINAQQIISTSKTRTNIHTSSTQLFISATATPYSTFRGHFLSTSAHAANNGIATMPTLTPLIQAIKPESILTIVAIRTTLKVLLQQGYKCQAIVQSFLSLGQPYEWDRSILGFFAEKGELLWKIMTMNYLLGLSITGLSKLGIESRAGLAPLLSRAILSLFTTHVVEQFCSRFVGAFCPKLAGNRRRRYVVGRAASACLWSLQLLTLGGMISAFLQVPLKTVLAAGGVGGLVLGLSARDVAANLLGGLTLLVNEPFAPGDFVSFKTGGSELVGRVESVGWGQTCVRCKDTRPVYVPNSHFVAASVTNLERITHRKFETTIQLRHEVTFLFAHLLHAMVLIRCSSAGLLRYYRSGDSDA